MDDTTTRPDDELEGQSASLAGAPGADDELPEDEPLTPELVEEEAVRGDFMLRWAAVLLTLLFAFGQFSDTRLLVHIRSGEQMQSQGFLPPRTDTLSFTAEGTAVPNTTWLLDQVLAGIWRVGGDTGLTLFKVIVAGFIAVLLSRISIPEMPTWWNSICAVLAGMAVAADFVPGTQLITLLGVVLVVRWLQQWQEGRSRGLAWKLPVLIAVWCNLDSHAWIGPLMVLLFAAGQGLRQRIAVRRDGVRDETGSQENLLVAGGVAALALLVNPFPLNSLFSPIAFYSVEVPSMQMQRPATQEMAQESHDNRVDYYSALNPDAWNLFDHTQVAGLLLLLMAVVMALISRRREDLPLLAVTLGLMILSLLALHELAATAIVAAVFAGTVAQRWYRRSFRLTYSIDSRELLFSRGGRALTVFAMAFLGFCIVAGRLPGSTPLGFGYEPNTAITIASIGRQLDGIAPDANILNTRIDHGDILIWHGRKSCIDSRLAPFGRSGDPSSIIARHRGILMHLFHPQPPREPQAPVGPEEEQKHEKELQQFADGVKQAQADVEAFGITYAMPRLAPPGEPDYQSVRNLVASGDWVLSSLGSSSALLHRARPTWTIDERQSHMLDFATLAFREVPEPNPAAALREFASPPNFYETWVYRRRFVLDDNLRMANHYLKLSDGAIESLEHALTVISMRTLAIRHANAAVNADKQNSVAWRRLGQAFHTMGMLEQAIASQQPGQSVADLRYYQAVIALRQAVRIDPNDVEAWSSLNMEYERRGCIDLALECQEAIPLPEGNIVEGSQVAVETTARFERMRELRDSLRAYQDQTTKMLEDNPLSSDPAERAQQVVSIAASHAGNGFPRMALDLLQQHADAIRPSPDGQVMLGDLLLQTGDCEQAYQILNQLASAAREHPQSFIGIDWHQPAAFSQLATGNYGEATSMLTQRLQQFQIADRSPETWGTALLASPIAPDAVLAMSARVPPWPLMQTQGLQVPLKGLPSVRAAISLQTALIHIEEGNMSRARLYLQTIISDFGFTPFRALAAYYLLLIDPDAGEFIQRHSVTDWEPFSFGDEPPVTETTEGNVP